MFKKNTKLYLLILSIPLLLGGVLGGISYLYLRNSDEFRSTAYLAEKHLRTNGIYGSALQTMTISYKTELYKRIRPEVIALGSSRVLQFKASTFNTSFMTLGGMAGGPIEAAITIEKLLALHKPKLIILGIDYWWLNENLPEPYTARGQQREQSQLRFSSRHLIEPWTWLVSGKIPPGQFLHRTLSPQEDKHSGVGGIVWQDGHDINGSYFYTSRSRYGRGDPDKMFRARLETAVAGEKHHKPADRIGPGKRKEIKKMIAALKNAEMQGSEILMVMVPPAPALYDVITTAPAKEKNFGYLDDINPLLQGQGIEYHDLLDPGALNTSDCEFYDAVHGGDVLYRRILLDIAKTTQTSLPGYLNFEEINTALSESTGYASHPHDGEIDFLKLGCDK